MVQMNAVFDKQRIRIVLPVPCHRRCIHKPEIVRFFTECLQCPIDFLGKLPVFAPSRQKQTAHDHQLGIRQLFMNALKHLLFIVHTGGDLFLVRSFQRNIVIRPCLEEHNIGMVGIQQLVGIVYQVLIRAAAEAMVLHPIFRQIVLHLRPHTEIGRAVEDDAVLVFLGGIGLLDFFYIRIPCMQE